MKKFLHFIFPLAAVALSSTLLLTSADLKFQDWFQRPLKSTPEDNSVIMLNVNDYTIENIGLFPLTRDVYADCLFTMRELGADAAVFDLGFLEKSTAQVDEAYVNETLPAYIENYFENYSEGFSSLQETLDGVLTSVSYVVKPYDSQLEAGLKFFDNSYLGFTLDDAAVPNPQRQEFYSNYVALGNVIDEGDTLTPQYDGAIYALSEFVANSNGAGFVNSLKDSDGYLRHLHLVAKLNGKYYAQLMLLPLMNRLGNPQLCVSNSSITLKDARFADGSKKDIVIPRTRDGSVMIKYPKKNYDDYNTMALWNVYRISLLEQDLSSYIRVMDDWGLFNFADENSAELLAQSEYVKNEISLNGENHDAGIDFDLFMNFKNAYLASLENFFEGSVEEQIIGSLKDDEEFAQEVHELFVGAKQIYSDLKESRLRTGSRLEGAMCVIGTNASSTSDWGINQYQKHFPNPGVHYALANMILAGDFVDDTFAWVSIVIALVICLLYSLVNSKIKSTGKQILLGVLFILGTCVLLYAYYFFTRQFLGFVVPLVSVSLTFISSTILGFLTASKDKKFITNAFSQCLSKEVVQEIVAHPESFKLGGQKLEMTAIFTDIQKFSSFSELLTPGQLVSLLNYYLTRMSDLIMEQRGTVDKYEGDAIIALVGAPVQMKDHADRALTAALKMKQAEKEMNKEIQKVASLPKPQGMESELYEAFSILVANKKSIFTRIGINSGEMIAGYMGSEKKKNYTMMGNNVNLASRLEGVNKQYSTGGVLISESTKNLLSDSFVLRRLDRVRVVNVNTPIRLYEAIALKNDSTAELETYIAGWEEAMNLFESREWQNALDKFRTLAESRPEDSVAKYYINLIEKYFIRGTFPTAQDGEGVVFDERDGVFALMQK